jgi:hypothetical protein
MSEEYDIIDDDDDDIDIDDEEVEVKKSNNTPVKFMGVVYFKLLFSIFLIFLFISSDVFIDKVLGNIDGATEHKNPTSKGVMVQATVMILLIIVIDFLLRLGFP